MISLRSVTLCIICTISTTFLYSQDDLAGVFDDPDARFSLTIGTDFIRTLGGTPNIKAEAIVNGTWALDAEIGSPLFGYRINFFDLEREIKSGLEFNIGAGAYINSFNFLGDGIFYVGLDFEKWVYTSTSLKLAEDHGFYEWGVPFASLAISNYTLDPEYEFNFKRKLTRIVIDLGAEYELRDRLSVYMGFHVIFGRKRFEFNDEDSFGVNWIAGESFFASSSRYKIDFGGRYSLSLKYRLL